MTNDANYVLVLRSDEAHLRGTDRATLIAHLVRVPGVVASPHAPDRFTFGDPDAHGVMTLEFHACRGAQRISQERATAADRVRCDEIEIHVPRPWVLERGPRVFALVFMLAEWAKWEVYDPQIEDTLQKEAVLSGLVAMRQAERDAATRPEPSSAPTLVRPESGDPARRAPTNGPWWKRPR